MAEGSSRISGEVYWLLIINHWENSPCLPYSLLAILCGAKPLAKN